MKIENKIKDLRKSKGLTQNQLANIIGVSAVTINRYENNNREPNIETLAKIAKALDVTIDQLVGLSDEYNRATALSNTYFKSVMIWSEDRSFSPNETICIREHFFDLLLRYKRLIESLSNLDCVWENVKESYLHIYKYREDPLSDTEIRELFLNQELKTEINDLAGWSKAFPDWIIRREIELNNESNIEIKK